MSASVTMPLKGQAQNNMEHESHSVATFRHYGTQQRQVQSNHQVDVAPVFHLTVVGPSKSHRE